MEYLVTKDADESTPAYENHYVPVKNFKLIVAFRFAYPAPKNIIKRLFLRSFKQVEGVITVPEGATVGEALQRATYNFSESYPNVNFTRAIVFYKKGQQHIAVIDRSADAGTIFNDGPMVILNEPGFYERRGWQVFRWVLLGIACFVFAVTMLVLATT